MTKGFRKFLLLWAGELADRFDRRLLMMLGDGLSAVGIVYIFISMQNGGAELWQICLGVTISSIFSSLMEPAYKATASDLLSKEEYVKASGLVSIAGSARYLISPLIAGLLLAVTDIKLLLVIDICTFFLTVATTAVVRNGLERNQTKSVTSFADDLKCGWNTVAGNRGIMTLVVMAAVMTFCMGVMQILSEPMVLDFESSRTLGIVETICAAGMLVTSVILGAKGMKKGIVKALSLSLCFAGVFADVIARLSGLSVGRSCGALIMVSGILLVVSALALYFTKSVRELEKSC